MQAVIHNVGNGLPAVGRRCLDPVKSLRQGILRMTALNPQIPDTSFVTGEVEPADFSLEEELPVLICDIDIKD